MSIQGFALILAASFFGAAIEKRRGKIGALATNLIHVAVALILIWAAFL